MLTCLVLVGIPASGKSTWAKEHVSKDPLNWIRVNNDDIRAMFNGSIYSSSYEKFVTDTREFIIRQAFKKNKNVIIDNLNITSKHFDSICAIASASNKDIIVEEKIFYIDVGEAIRRDSIRSASVGAKVISKWYKDSGGESLKDRVPRKVTFDIKQSNVVTSLPSNGKQKAIICDIDGTLAIVGKRSPYDASKCDILDSPNKHVIETVKLYDSAGHKILFCSGRKDIFREPTERFINKAVPGVGYTLFMRNSSDNRSDDIIKEELFNKHIRDNFDIKLVLDDRISVCRMWHSLGLPLMRVGDPEAVF